MALIDSIDGTVSQKPFYILRNGIPYATFEGTIRPLDVPAIYFQLNSHLLIVRGCPEETKLRLLLLQLTGRGLKLIRKIPATMEKKFE